MFKNMNEVIEANKQFRDGYWFSDGAMSFFNSEIESELIHGRYFITSERYKEDGKKLYTIRRANKDGSIDTVGEFQEFEWFSDAYYKAMSLKKK